MIYIDVRSKDEWLGGHIKGAIHFDLEKIMHGSLPQVEKTQEIKIYCASGSRAELAKRILEQNGFSNVENVGGIHELEGQGLEVEMGE